MSLNKVILVGNVGQDPQVRYFDNGNAVANFRLATTERGYRTQNGTEVPERTEWHNVGLWRGLAETAENKQVILCGSTKVAKIVDLSNRICYDKPGNKRNSKRKIT